MAGNGALEMSVSLPEPCGVTACVAPQLADFIDLLAPDAKLVMRPGQNKGSAAFVEIKAGTSTWARIPALSAGDYPRMQASEPTSLHATMPCGTLERLLAAAVPAADDSQVAGRDAVEFEVQTNRLTCAATNGAALGVAVATVSTAEGATGRCALPARTVPHIRRLLRRSGDVAIEFKGRRMVFTAGTARLTASTLESKLPDWRKVLLPNTPTIGEVDRQVFLATLKRVLAIAPEKSILELDASTKDGGIEVRTPVSSRTEARERIAVTVQAGFQVSINGLFLRDAVESMPGERVKFRLGSKVAAATTPLQIEGVGEGVHALWLIAPRRA